MSLTLLQIRTRVARKLQDAGFVFFTSAAVDDAINEAQNIYAKETGCLRKPVTLANDAAFDADHPTAFYRLPAGVEMIMIASAKYPGHPPLAHRSLEEMDEQLVDWEDDEATVPEVIVTSGYGHGVFRTWPKPAVAHTTLRAVVTVMPTPLAADADVPSIPAVDHEALVDGAIAVLADSDDPDTANPTLAATHGGKFQAAIAAAQVRTVLGNDSHARQTPGRYY